MTDTIRNDAPMTTVAVTGIHVYPVKSMRGISLEEAILTPKGLARDRQWMVAEPDGRFVTQRDNSKLALLDTRLDDNGVTLSMPGHGSITVPHEKHDGERVVTRIWKDACEDVDQGRDISAWLTRALASEKPLRLLAMSPGFTRPLHKAPMLGEGTTTGFADAAPFLVANEASLDELNTRLESAAIPAVPMNRFRPNIVISGLQAFAEHRLQSLVAPDYQLDMRYPCERCVVTTIDQETAVRHPQAQPFKTLAEINPMPGSKRAPAFAENAVLAHGNLQKIAVGDQLRAVFR
jgi:uncharacterized protein YcbX